MPSFSIEAEGETNPLSAQSVLGILKRTSGVNATQQSLKVASQQLANWERSPGFYSILQALYADLENSDDVRLQAIIQLKNGIDKHWRKTSTHAINNTEKAKIRAHAIEAGLRETRQNLALQNALMLAKIVRYEFPHDWPDVITILISSLRKASNLEVESTYITNILVITLQVIKELASGRLQRTKKSLQSVAPELLVVLGQLYVNLVQRWSANGQDIQDMINSHAALKTLRRLLIAGFEHPHRDHTVKQFWSLLQQHHEQVWLAWRDTPNKTTTQATYLMKHLFQYVKLYLEMARNHPASFVLLGCMNILNRSWIVISGTDAKAALAGSLDWTVHRNGDVEEETSPIEKLALKALLLFRACMKMVFQPVQTFKYQYPEDKADRNSAIDQIRSTVFTNEFIIQLMEILITQYFVLRPQDLKDWEEEPDEWERREEEIADAWEFSIRSCSEKLFLDLIINFKELLVPRLLQVFQQYATVDNHDILLKDSLYSAIGTAAACVEDVFDINTLIRTVLIPEVQLQLPHYNVLRRRIAILLGQWVPIKPEIIDRPSVYQIYAFLLSAQDKLNDQVVRVTAGRQLRLVLEPFEFDSTDFEPYATPILSNVMNLIAETELSETKMALLETVRVAVTKLESKIEPYAEAIMSILPSLWQESGEEHLIKQAILTMITAIVTSLGHKGVAFHAPILSLIRDAVQPDSEAIVYLLEEALDLWAAILQQTPTNDPPPSQELLSLSHSLLPLLELGSEHLRQCFELIESYTVLSPATILDTTFLVPFLTSMRGLLSMLSSSRARDAALAPHVVENLISTIATPAHFNDSARSQVMQHLISNMIETNYLPELLSILKEAYEYHQDPRPNRKPPDVIGVGETSLFNLIARFATSDPDILLQALQATGNTLDWLVPEWIDHFDSIGDTLRKKLQVMGLSNLLVASIPPPPVMLESLQSLMNVWIEVVTEVADGAADENEGDYLWSGASLPLPDWPDEPPEDRRKRAVSNNDPIYTVNLRHFISELLQRVIAATGGLPTFQHEWLGRIDSAVLRSFADLKLL